jgi:hypothetical protein
LFFEAKFMNGDYHGPMNYGDVPYVATPLSHFQVAGQERTVLNIWDRRKLRKESSGKQGGGE